MDTTTVVRALQNSGINVLGADSANIYVEDPACILRAFSTFVEYAWIVIACITGVLIFAWGVSMLRGAKNDIFTNLRNLMMIFLGLTIVGPIINMLWGDDLMSRGCARVTVPIDGVREILDARNARLGGTSDNAYYEYLDIYDSAQNTAAVGVYPDAPQATIAPAPAPASAPAPAQTGDVPNRNNTSPTVAHAPHDEGASHASAAVESGKDVIYTYPNGDKYKYTGGNRAWRNNNPGCIRMSEFARKNGAIGSAGNFAVFPDETVGFNAIKSLLRTERYNAKTLGDAISTWAPAADGNNVASYRTKMSRLTGLSLDRRMNTLSDGELTRVADAIATIEGFYKPGQKVKI